MFRRELHNLCPRHFFWARKVKAEGRQVNKVQEVRVRRSGQGLVRRWREVWDSETGCEFRSAVMLTG